MAIERAGTLNSADLGVSLRGNFGGELEDAKVRTGNHHYAGKFGIRGLIVWRYIFTDHSFCLPHVDIFLFTFFSNLDGSTRSRLGLSQLPGQEHKYQEPGYGLYDDHQHYIRVA